MVCGGMCTWYHLHSLLCLRVQLDDRHAPAPPESVCGRVLVLVLEAVHDLLQLVSELELPHLERLQAARPPGSGYG